MRNIATPQTVSSIIAKILVGMSDTIEAAEIYDPAAGSGSLILHLAHELGQEGGMVAYLLDNPTTHDKVLDHFRVELSGTGGDEEGKIMWNI